MISIIKPNGFNYTRIESNMKNCKNLQRMNISFNIDVPMDVKTSDIFDNIKFLCNQKNWELVSGSVTLIDDYEKEIEIKEKQSDVYYHGSPLILEYLNAGCDITPCKELAEAFSHKPTDISIHSKVIKHNGIQKGYLYIVDEKIEIGKDIEQHQGSAFTSGLEMLTKRILKLKYIGEAK